MTCDDVERILLDSISGSDSETSMLRAFRAVLVQAHVRDCPACATKMREADRLEGRLDELRLSTRHMQAPDAVERELLDAFQWQVAKRHSFGRTIFPWRLGWVSAVVVVLVAAGVLFFSKSGPNFLIRTPMQGREAEIRPPKTPGLSGAAPWAFNNERAGTAENPVNESKTQVSKAGKPKSGNVELRAAATLNDELSLNGGGSVVRVTLPLSSLTAMGLPVHADLSDPRVTADVWMDPFGGVMRVRLVAENRDPNRE